MQNDKINQYNLLIPKINTRLKQLKNKRKKKIQRINQVSDPAMTLVSATEVSDNMSIKRENVMKIKAYFESVVLSQAKIDVSNSKYDCKALYLTFKNQITKQLNKIEDAIVKLNSKIQGEATKFLEEFGNGALNEDSKFLAEMEKLVATLTLKKLAPSSNNTFEKIKTYFVLETQKTVENLKNFCANISKEPSQPISSLFESSTIVKLEENEMINQWIQDQVGSSKIFESLFNTKDHGFTVQAFHSKCDNKGPTIVFIETTLGKRFGGYANSSWKNNNSVSVDEKCFVFSLDLKEKYMHKPGNGNSMLGYSGYGPIFGSGSYNDIIIYDNCNIKNDSSCHYNNTYNFGTRTNIDIAGTHNFTVKNYEVYLVKQAIFYFKQAKFHNNQNKCFLFQIVRLNEFFLQPIF